MTYSHTCLPCLLCQHSLQLKFYYINICHWLSLFLNHEYYWLSLMYCLFSLVRLVSTILIGPWSDPMTFTLKSQRWLVPDKVRCRTGFCLSLTVGNPALIDSIQFSIFAKSLARKCTSINVNINIKDCRGHFLISFLN